MILFIVFSPIGGVIGGCPAVFHLNFNEIKLGVEKRKSE